MAIPRPCRSKEELPKHLIPLNDGLDEVGTLMNAHFDFLKNRQDGVRKDEVVCTDAFCKSAVILLSAYWEAFVEDLALAMIDAFIAANAAIENLPLSLRKKLVSQLKNDKNELAVWAIANDGWKVCCRSVVETRVRALNNPSISNIQAMYRELFGIEVCTNWAWTYSSAETGSIEFTQENTQEFIDCLVDARNAFAHGRKPENEMHLPFLVHQVSVRMFKAATLMSNQVLDELKVVLGCSPWLRIDFNPNWKDFLICETSIRTDKDVQNPA